MYKEKAITIFVGVALIVLLIGVIVNLYFKIVKNTVVLVGVCFFLNYFFGINFHYHNLLLSLFSDRDPVLIRLRFKVFCSFFQPFLKCICKNGIIK